MTSTVNMLGAHQRADLSAIPELVKSIIDSLEDPADILKCAYVNRVWNTIALKRLYKGSLTDMRWRTPQIGYLNCLLTASRDRFAQYMSYVDHLALLPEMPSLDPSQDRGNNFACFETCRALRCYKDAKLLLRSSDHGFTSVVVPFEFKTLDVSPYLGFAYGRTLKYLAINTSYCKAFESALRLNVKDHPNEACQLAALLIYRSRSFEDSNIRGLLGTCNLQLFGMFSGRHPDRVHCGRLIDILESLKEHKLLRGLALMVEYEADRMAHITIRDLYEAIKAFPWQGMKALYLKSADQLLLKAISKLHSLQTLHIGLLTGENRFAARRASEAIANYRQVKTICIKLHQLHNNHDLLTVAHACPLLRRFDVHFEMWEAADQLTEAQVSELLKAMPYLELLSTNAPAKFTSIVLDIAAENCSRLLMLAFTKALLILSEDSLAKTVPLKCLEVLDVGQIFFTQPDQLRDLENLERLAQKWQRAFPLVQYIPCTTDLYVLEPDLYGPLPELSGIDEEIEQIDEMEMMQDSDLIEDNIFGSAWWDLRERLWKFLEYGRDRDLVSKTTHFWQVNFETQLLGLPMLSTSTYTHPVRHSTSKPNFPWTDDVSEEAAL